MIEEFPKFNISKEKISTNHEPFDYITNGIYDNSIICLYGKYKSCKSIFLLDLISKMQKNYNIAYIYSMIFYKNICELLGVDLNNLLTYKLDNQFNKEVIKELLNSDDIDCIVFDDISFIKDFDEEIIKNRKNKIIIYACQVRTCFSIKKAITNYLAYYTSHNLEFKEISNDIEYKYFSIYNPKSKETLKMRFKKSNPIELDYIYFLYNMYLNQGIIIKNEQKYKYKDIIYLSKKSLFNVLKEEVNKDNGNVFKI